MRLKRGLSRIWAYLYRANLVRELAKAIVTVGRLPRLFVQVNIGDEPQKAGVAPSELAVLLAECNQLGLAIEGLMCIPRADENPGPHFALLEKLARQAGIEKLSMGMSGDYELAVAFGATAVRVGSAIFGTR